MTSIVLAACLTMPSFSTDGPPCSPERQQLACECSEPLTMDVDEGVEWIEVERQTVSSGTWTRQGMIWGFEYCPDENMPCEWIEPVGIWFPPRDYSMPRADVLYGYRFRGCTSVSCGEWTNVVQYRAAPYACYKDGREVQCYVGDDIISR